MDSERLLDDVGRQILRELQENPRIGFTELGRRVGLTGNGVAERIRRLEELGVISGYRVDLNLEKLGLPILAYIRLNGADMKSARVDAAARNMPEILECHRVTGDEDYIMKVAVASVQHLETLISKLLTLGQPTTSIILSSAVTHKVIDLPAHGRHGPDLRHEETHTTR